MSTPERWTFWRFREDYPGGPPSRWFHEPEASMKSSGAIECETFVLGAVHEAALVEARTQEREKIADWLEGEARRKGLKPIAVALRLAAAIRSAEWVRSGGTDA